MAGLLSMKRQVLRSLFLIIVIAAGPHAANPQSDPKPDISAKFKAYTDYYFQEKVYMHVDKDSYISGETIWMKAYRTDAATHLPFYYSGVINVEIRDPENLLVRRMQMVKTGSCFMANYAIPADWSTGYYEIIAYTNWMQNFDVDFYFRKKIFIYNSKESVVDVDVKFIDDTNKQTVKVNALLSSNNGYVYKNKVLRIHPYASGVPLKSFIVSTDREGKLGFSLKKSDNITSFSMAFDNDMPMEYKRFFSLPIFDASIDVQFMPEGGHLLEGIPQRVAFKAIGADGKSVDMKGVVRDNSNNRIADISTTHLGMGEFSMTALSGVSYTAELTSADGRKVEAELPKAAAAGVALNVSVSGNVLVCRVLATPLYTLDDIYLGIHARGKILYWEKLNSASTVKLPLGNVPDGIVQCFLVDGQGRMYSDRLLLVNKGMQPEVEVTGLKGTYGQRQLVEMEIGVKVGDTELPSNLSVSVVDMKHAVVDKTDNIVSYMFLNSDIKGNVENPAYYFDKSVPAAERARNADLLMMTQAWKRFDVGAMIRGERPELKYSLDLRQSIGGKITRSFGGAAKDPELTLIGTYMGKNKEETKIEVVRVIDADENGEFYFDDLVFRDKTVFLIKGLQNGNKKNVAVTINPQEFKDIPYENILRVVQLEPVGTDVLKEESGPTTAVADNGFANAEKFYKKAGINYYYVDGERMIALDEVEIVKYRRGSDWGEVQLSEDAVYETSLDQMLDNRQYSVRDWLKSIPEIEIRNYDEPEDDPFYRERMAQQRRSASGKKYEEPVLKHGYESIYYNGMRVRVNAAYHDDVLDMPLSTIRRIWINPNANSTFSNVQYVSLVISTQDRLGMAGIRRDKLSMFEFGMMGYSVPDKFYAPKYDAGQSPDSFDERVTVHWEPNLSVEQGKKTKVSFYTTDMVTTYRVVIQGIGINGMPVYKEIELDNGAYGE